MFTLGFIAKNIESPDKTYVYTVTSAKDSNAVGNYYATDELFEGFPIYVNDSGTNGFIYFSSGPGCWVLIDMAEWDKSKNDPNWQGEFIIDASTPPQDFDVNKGDLTKWYWENTTVVYYSDGGDSAM